MKIKYFYNIKFPIYYFIYIPVLQNFEIEENLK